MRTLMQRVMAVLAVASVLGSTVANAHSDDYLDTVPGKHGGQLRMAGPWHFELVLDAKADGKTAAPVTLYLTDHANNDIASTGATAKITIISNNKPVQVQLTAKAPNLLVGEALYKAQPELKAVVQLTLAAETQQARFTPFAKPAAKPHAAGEAHHH